MPDIDHKVESREDVSFTATIYIAGDMSEIRSACRQYCLSGFCVSILPCSFCYTAGLEEGAAIGIINYPRFPRTPEVLQEIAEDLAKFLIITLYQASCTVVMPNKTIYLSRRKDDPWKINKEKGN
jgi:hypothetical protein